MRPPFERPGSITQIGCLDHGTRSTKLAAVLPVRCTIIPRMPKRDLTAGETAILNIIQQGYGHQNTANDVFFTKADEAAIFVKAPDGTSPMVANLSNLAAWRSDGTIKSDEELKRDWLRL